VCIKIIIIIIIIIINKVFCYQFIDKNYMLFRHGYCIRINGEE